MIPTPGRVVLVRLPDHHGVERLRPATVLQAFGPTCVNCHVQLDILNDRDLVVSGQIAGTPLVVVRGYLGNAPDLVAISAYGTSLSEGTAVGEWRWPPRASS